MNYFDYIFQKLVAAVEDTMNREDFENRGENDAFHYVYEILQDYCGRGTEVESCVFHVVYNYYYFRKNNLVEKVI